MFYWKTETKTINNVLFKRILYKFTKDGKRELKELTKEKQIIENNLKSFSEFELGTRLEVNVALTNFGWDDYKVSLNSEKKSEVFKTAIYLNEKDTKTKWEEIRNEKQEEKYLETRQEAFENFENYGAPTILALLLLHKLRKNNAF